MSSPLGRESRTSRRRLFARGSRCEPWAFVLALTPPRAARRMASRCCAQLDMISRARSRWPRRMNARPGKTRQVATFAWQHLCGNIWVATFGWHSRWPVLQKTGSILFPKRPPDPRKMAPRKKTGSISLERGPKCVGVLGCSGPPHSLDGPQAPQPARASWEAMGCAWPHLNPERRVPPPLAGPSGRDPEPHPRKRRVISPGLRLSVPTRADDNDAASRRRRCTATTPPMGLRVQLAQACLEISPKPLNPFFCPSTPKRHKKLLRGPVALFQKGSQTLKMAEV